VNPLPPKAPKTHESTLVMMKIRTAIDSLHVVRDRLDAAIEAARTSGASAGELGVASASLKSALLCLEEITGEVGAEAAMIDCSACGKSIRAAATLCGHCWTKR
jgi:hypothetical protein